MPISAMPEAGEKLNAVRRLLEVMVEPLARSLALAPVEEEEITPETAQALDRARASPAAKASRTKRSCASSGCTSERGWGPGASPGLRLRLP